MKDAKEGKNKDGGDRGNQKIKTTEKVAFGHAYSYNH